MSKIIQKFKEDQFREHVFLFLNFYLLISTIIVTYFTINFGTVAGQVDTGGSYGTFYLATFTVESNLLLGIVAGSVIIQKLFGLNQAKYRRFFAILYLVAASAAMLTCVTVVFFLAPARALKGRNYFDMLIGPMFFFHFFNPVLAAVGLIFFGEHYHFQKRERLFVLIPPLIYAVPYTLNVVFTKMWTDFYGLTFGGKNWLIIPSFVVLGLAVYSVGWVISKLHNRYS